MAGRKGEMKGGRVARLRAKVAAATKQQGEGSQGHHSHCGVRCGAEVIHGGKGQHGDARLDRREPKHTMSWFSSHLARASPARQRTRHALAGSKHFQRLQETELRFRQRAFDLGWCHRQILTQRHGAHLEESRGWVTVWTSSSWPSAES